VTTSRVFEIDDAAVMLGLLGAGDSVLAEVERTFPGVNLLVRGNQMSLSGPDVAVAACAAALDELRSLVVAGVPLTPRSRARR